MSEINVIGAACMDILLYPVDRESFFSGKYKTDHIRMYPGGDALNETLILGHFKADTKLIAILGDDFCRENSCWQSWKPEMSLIVKIF